MFPRWFLFVYRLKPLPEADFHVFTIAIAVNQGKSYHLNLKQQKNKAKSAAMLYPFVVTASTIISLYSFVVITAVVLQLLISFNIVNRNQPLVYQINFALRKLTEPVFQPIRKRLPDLGGIDISPVIVLVGLQFLDVSLRHYLLPL